MPLRLSVIGLLPLFTSSLGAKGVQGGVQGGARHEARLRRVISMRQTM